MEQIIYIEQNDKNEASKLSGGFTIEETRTRAYINALGCELGMKYLAHENISVSNIYNIHNIHKIREEFDIADIMLPNIHIDVRVVYDENMIFIPKSHFEYNLTPDIYLVFKMSEDIAYVEFLGFFEPKLINKNNQNKDYYFIEKEKLSHPSDLKAYIEKFNGNTTESLPEDEFANCQRLALSLIDHDITESDKKKLIKMLSKSASLREELIDFDNFEFVSYHTATSEDFDNITSTTEDIETTADEFDLFDETDEFNALDEEPQDEDVFEDIVEESDSEDAPEDTESNEILQETDDDIEEEATEDSDEDYTLTDEIQSGEETSEEELLDETDDLTNYLNEDIQDALSGNLAAIDNLVPQNDETDEEPENETDEELSADEPDGDLAGEGIEDTDTSKILDTLLSDEFTQEDEALPDIELEELPQHDEEILNADMEDLAVDETVTLDKLTIDEPVEEETHEEYTPVTESFEDIGQLPEEENTEEESTPSVTPIENLTVEEDTESDTTIENPIEETVTLESLENIEDNVSEENPEEITDTISFDELSENKEIVEEEPQTINLEELASQDNDDFLEALAQETEAGVSYANSTVITNENTSPGEFSIDINLNNENTTEEMEKLGVLYNENNDIDYMEQDIETKTTAPERGKKAIFLATAIIAALASLLIFASFNKSNNKIAEQNNSSVLEKNLPKIDEQQLDDNIEKVVPQTSNAAKLDETAKQVQENITKPQTPAIESPYIDVKKLSWAVPDYVSYNDDFKKYLQTAGKSLKLTLSSDLLLATEYAYSNVIQVDITLSKEGVYKDAKILQSSGSTQIDNIVLRTVKDTLNVVKAPSGVIVGDNIHLTLKIYL